MKLFGHGIAIAFLFIVGVSLVVARARGAGPRAFWRRFFLIAGAAGLVSLGTYFAFPQAFVFFGILHCIALASLLAAPLLPAPWPAALLAALVAALAPMFLASPAFNTSWLNWIGLSTFEPLTNDYRPIRALVRRRLRRRRRGEVLGGSRLGGDRPEISRLGRSLGLAGTVSRSI